MKPSGFKEVTWTHKFLYEILEQIPINACSIIDVGCGRGIVGALVRIYRHPKRLVGIDAFSPYLDFCRYHNFYDELYQYDLRNIPLPFKDKEFDVATCIEVIEHLPKNSGIQLLKELERIAKKVIVTTPNGSLPQEALDNNLFQRHLSNWYVKDFIKQGFAVKGLGVKYLSFLLSKFNLFKMIYCNTILAYKITKEDDEQDMGRFS